MVSNKISLYVCAFFVCYDLIFNPSKRFGRSKSNQPILSSLYEERGNDLLLLF